jgi:hypothetical protein
MAPINTLMSMCFSVSGTLALDHSRKVTSFCVHVSAYDWTGAWVFTIYNPPNAQLLILHSIFYVFRALQIEVLWHEVCSRIW